MYYGLREIKNQNTSDDKRDSNSREVFWSLVLDIDHPDTKAPMYDDHVYL